jgi:hypothetical protein
MNSPATLFCFVTAGALLLAACDKKATPPVTDSTGTPTVTSSQGAMLSASPNPVPAGSTPGTTTIKWSTGLSPTAEVYVSTNGEKEALFASGAEGSSDAPWIQAGMTYEFRLYAGEEHKNVLARVVVTRQK